MTDEERLAQLEAEVVQLKKQIAAKKQLSAVARVCDHNFIECPTALNYHLKCSKCERIQLRKQP